MRTTYQLEAINRRRSYAGVVDGFFHQRSLGVGQQRGWLCSGSPGADARRCTRGVTPPSRLVRRRCASRLANGRRASSARCSGCSFVGHSRFGIDERQVMAQGAHGNLF